ncbi:30S ribosome-binding factor RbfA [Syntrophomonas wolfei]|uniref:Ribosome-binding factor A n=1 Tax=Syntrophomonas wolfei subsp. wolfei (strain DSM 2245B / Goettingen) TaxID=335541 RepID=RBFA_SYNWW|nr:30S ribosome-binding factor RbfA [Syntrophomonas wolfei]Q0AYI7.1 RecName: Full=Ribosome-binding factor A [Syntrophomonas wolfei subsp. wolfei str. Goettingen G311]ABI68217.1 ribosome-binding factor A [Syntrophomonas wolfei subsp. wolfei str. Goettingen G311]
MSKRRQERMSVEIMRVLSQIIQEEIKDPRIEFKNLSITRIDLSNDYSHARVNISILGDEIQREEAMKALQKAKGYIRSALAQQLKVRHAPELEFRLDRSIEHGIRISSLLEEIKEEAKGSNE